MPDQTLSSHPWTLLVRAAEQGQGITLTAVQVRELLADYYAVVEKNNELLRLNAAMADRVHQQSELLGRKSERTP